MFHFSLISYRYNFNAMNAFFHSNMLCQQKNYYLYLLRLDETMTLIISLLEYFAGATTLRNFQHNKYIYFSIQKEPSRDGLVRKL